jgi:hypothetical protein
VALLLGDVHIIAPSLSKSFFVFRLTDAAPIP